MSVKKAKKFEPDMSGVVGSTSAGTQGSVSVTVPVQRVGMRGDKRPPAFDHDSILVLDYVRFLQRQLASAETEHALHAQHGCAEPPR